jgi:hypothetical protein
MIGSRLREVDAGGPRPALAAHDLVAARTFYIGLLRGTLVSAARRHTERARLSFRIDGVLVETGPGAHGGAPVLLHVDDPLAVAERCWDAGFSVRLRDRPFGDAIVSVTDPFGREIDLVRHACRCGAAGASGA